MAANLSRRKLDLLTYLLSAKTQEVAEVQDSLTAAVPRQSFGVLMAIVTLGHAYLCHRALKVVAVETKAPKAKARSKPRSKPRSKRRRLQVDAQARHANNCTWRANS